MLWIKRCGLLLLGVIIGVWVGGEFAVRYVQSKQVKYSRELEDHFIDSRIFLIGVASATISRSEGKDPESAISLNRHVVRWTFVDLANLHKTGHYTDKDEAIRKRLFATKHFIEARPKEFIEQGYSSVGTIIKDLNAPGSSDLEKKRETDWAKSKLQNALDYVGALEKSNPLKGKDQSTTEKASE